MLASWRDSEKRKQAWEEERKKNPSFKPVAEPLLVEVPSGKDVLDGFEWTCLPKPDENYVPDSRANSLWPLSKELHQPENQPEQPSNSASSSSAPAGVATAKALGQSKASVRSVPSVAAPGPAAEQKFSPPQRKIRLEPPHPKNHGAKQQTGAAAAAWASRFSQGTAGEPNRPGTAAKAGSRGRAPPLHEVRRRAQEKQSNQQRPSSGAASSSSTGAVAKAKALGQHKRPANTSAVPKDAGRPVSGELPANNTTSTNSFPPTGPAAGAASSSSKAAGPPSNCFKIDTPSISKESVSAASLAAPPSPAVEQNDDVAHEQVGLAAVSAAGSSQDNPGEQRGREATRPVVVAKAGAAVGYDGRRVGVRTNRVPSLNAARAALKKAQEKAKGEKKALLAPCDRNRSQGGQKK